MSLLKMTYSIGWKALNLCCLWWLVGSPKLTNLWANFAEPVLWSTANRFAVHHLNHELCDYGWNTIEEETIGDSEKHWLEYRCLLEVTADETVDWDPPCVCVCCVCVIVIVTCHTASINCHTAGKLKLENDVLTLTFSNKTKLVLGFI